MIKVCCKNETFIYNAYHMVKAFYPAQEVQSCVEEKASNYVTIDFDNGDSIVVAESEITGTPADEKEKKRETDRALYKKLSEYSGKELAWGMLLGVRPTKLAMKKLEEGMQKGIFISWFQERTMANEKKAALAYDIAVRERELLGRLAKEDGYSLYIGIPFCPTVCSYCSFSSGALSDWKDRVEDYLDALCKELLFIADSSKGKILNTIYIGGGTPTTLTAEQLERLLVFVNKHFSKEHLLEFTVEAGRPDSINREKLEVLKNQGVTRISVNPQTMQQKTLDVIGRKHTVEEIYDAFLLARKVGFDNINMDIIAGLPGETLEDMKDTLEQIRMLKPDSLTVHSLAIKRAAKMGQEQHQGRTITVSEEIGSMIEAAFSAAEEMKLYPYYLYRQKNIAGNFENVGYAKVDKAGIYNILIMEEKQTIIAAGAGASTKIVLKEPVELPGSKKHKMTSLMRQENVKAIDAYIERVDEMIGRKGEWLWR